MAKFTNDLTYYISIIQHEEMLDSINERFERQRKDSIIIIGLTTGAVVAAGTFGILANQPLAVLLGLASVGLTQSIYDLHQNRKYLNQSLTDLSNIDYRELARKQRERDRYKGKLKYKSSYSYELSTPEYIEEEFGHSSDNDLPVQFLEQHLVPERILREYELYSKRYNVPQLNISEDEIVDFVNKLSELLKKVNMSHRIYFYTSEYFKRLISKGIINYWDEITLETLLSQLEVFKRLELTDEDIKEFIGSFSKEKQSKNSSKSLFML